MKNRIIVFIDKSGSMSHLRRDLVIARNKLYMDMKRENRKYKQNTLITEVWFGDGYTVKFKNRKLDNITDISNVDYNPTDSWTNLHDSLGKVLKSYEETEDFVDDDVSFLVIGLTDGEENHSPRVEKEFNKYHLANLIKKYQKTGKWTITFQVPRGDKQRIISDLGLNADNVREWDTTSEGIAETTHATSKGVGSYFDSRSRGLTNVASFYAVTDASQVKSTDLKRKLDEVTDEYDLFNVPREYEIREFVEQKGKNYTKGCAYYQLMKNERVQARKQVLIMDKKNKKIYGGYQARQMIGIPQGVEVKVDPGNHANYDIFVQSTSTNRKLPRGTKLLVRN